MEAVRNHVYACLATHDIAPVYLSPDTQPSHTKPEGPHIPILSSNLEFLKQKKSVIIVCGQETYDPESSTHPDALSMHGLHQSSLLSIAAHLAVWKYMTYLRTNGQDITYATVTNEAEALPFTIDSAFQDKNTPGLILLNPTQHDSLNIQDANLIAGHETAAQHVETFFKSILSKVINSKAKICLIGVGEGAGHIIQALDSVLDADSKHPLNSQLGKTTLIIKSSCIKDLKSSVLKDHLAEAGRTWDKVVKKPKGPSRSIPIPIPVRPKTVIYDNSSLSSLNSYSSLAAKEFIPFQNTNFSPPPSSEDPLFPMQGTPSMIIRDQEAAALVDADRQRIAQIRRISTDRRQFITNWVVANTDTTNDPNEGWISAGPEHDDLEARGIAAGSEGGHDSDDALFIAGHRGSQSPLGGRPGSSDEQHGEGSEEEEEEEEELDILNMSTHSEHGGKEEQVGDGESEPSLDRILSGVLTDTLVEFADMMAREEE